MKRILSLALVMLAMVAAPASAKDSASDAAPAPATETVKVAPQARDHEIEARLEHILGATKWFQKLDVRVQEGVVFLEGTRRATMRRGPRTSRVARRMSPR